MSNKTEIWMSPSKLNQINPDLDDSCQRCFWLEHVRGMARPAGIFATLMSGIDKVLKEYYGKFRNSMVAELRESLPNVKLWGHIAQLSVWQNNFKGIQHYFDDNAIGLRGAVDDIGIIDDKYLVPVDFKTRGYPYKPSTTDYYRLQLDSYVLLLKLAGYDVNGTAYLIYYWPHAVSMSDVTINKSLHIDFDHHVQKYEGLDGRFAMETLLNAKRILNMTSPPPASAKCPYCQYAINHHHELEAVFNQNRNRQPEHVQEELAI